MVLLHAVLGKGEPSVDATLCKRLSYITASIINDTLTKIGMFLFNKTLTEFDSASFTHE